MRVHGGTAAHEYNFIWEKKMYMQYIEKKKKSLEENILKCQQWLYLAVGSRIFILSCFTPNMCWLCNLNFIYLFLSQILQPTVLFSQLQ